MHNKLFDIIFHYLKLLNVWKLNSILNVVLLIFFTIFILIFEIFQSVHKRSNSFG